MERLRERDRSPKGGWGTAAAFARLAGLSLFLASCTGVLNDPAVRKGSLFIEVDNDTTNQYQWKATEEVKGNQNQITITGTCGSDIPRVTVDVLPEDSSNASKALSFNVPCQKDGTWIAAFDGSKAFTANGRYKILFSSVTEDVVQAKVEVTRIYDYYNVPKPETMVVLQCVDKNSGNLIPIEAGDECNVYTKKKNTSTGQYEEYQRLRLDGACSTETSARGDQTTIIVDNVKRSCPSVSSDDSSRGTGAHRIEASWQDTWGNKYSRTILVKVFDLIEWYAGGMSFVSAGSFESITNYNGYRVEVAVGSPYQDYENVNSDSVPFSRPPINGGGPYSTRVAPGFLSLIYGLSDGT